MPLLDLINVAKDQHHAFFGTTTGKTLWKNLLFDNSIQGFRSLQTMSDNLMTQHGLSECVYGTLAKEAYRSTSNHLSPGIFWFAFLSFCGYD